MKSKKKMESPFGCSECAWKGEQFEGLTPCEICIRSSKTISKRWNGPKEVEIKGLRLEVPRDMYISKEMLEFFKKLFSTQAAEIDALRALLRRFQAGVSHPYGDWATTITYPNWTVTFGDNSTGNTTWLSWQTKKWSKNSN